MGLGISDQRLFHMRAVAYQVMEIAQAMQMSTGGQRATARQHEASWLLNRAHSGGEGHT